MGGGTCPASFSGRFTDIISHSRRRSLGEAAVSLDKETRKALVDWRIRSTVNVQSAGSLLAPASSRAGGSPNFPRGSRTHINGLERRLDHAGKRMSG